MDSRTTWVSASHPLSILHFPSALQDHRSVYVRLSPSYSGVTLITTPEHQKTRKFEWRTPHTKRKGVPLTVKRYFKMWLR